MASFVLCDSLCSYWGVYWCFEWALWLRADLCALAEPLSYRKCPIITILWVRFFERHQLHTLSKQIMFTSSFSTADVERFDAQISSIFGGSLCERSAQYVCECDGHYVHWTDWGENGFSEGHLFALFLCRSPTDLWQNNKWWLLSWRWSLILHRMLR